MMSERDLQRIEVLTEVPAGRCTVASAATVLDVTVRQVGRLLLRYRDEVELRSKGIVLPYRVFDKDQRVSPAAVVENKRSGHALSRIKAQQDTRLAPTVQTNSEKNSYRKRGRTILGAPPAKTAVERCKLAKSGEFTHSHNTTASYVS